MTRHATASCAAAGRESDPDYVAYHDTEWGVPSRDDRGGCSSS